MNIFKNRCLFISEALYRLCRIVDRKGDYRINILMVFYKNRQRGHAWLVRNGRDFLHLGRTFDEERNLMVGEDGKYRYFVQPRNLELLDLNQIREVTKSKR